MAAIDFTAPTRAHSLDIPAVIAGNVDLLKLSEALTLAGLCGRYDGARELVIIEPAVPAVVIPFPSQRTADPAAEDARAGIAWFNGLTPAERRYWLEAADSAVPADAWRAFQSGGAAVSAAILPFPARESAVPIGEISRDELEELLDQIGQITSVFTYTAPEERPCIHWWQSFSTAERRRLLKRYGHPVNAWRAHNAGKSHP